jgi:hypothetical protein
MTLKRIWNNIAYILKDSKEILTALAGHENRFSFLSGNCSLPHKDITII